jgi:hypothetical protein
MCGWLRTDRFRWQQVYGAIGFGAEPDYSHNPKREGCQLRVNGAAGTLGSIDRPSLPPWRLVANLF